MKPNFRALVVAMAAVATTCTAPNVWADNVRIAFLDPLSGSFANIGEPFLNSFRSLTEAANKEKWAGEHTLEMVPFDNKASVQESLIQLKTIIDQGFGYVFQGSNSAATLALVEAISKHNARNPGKEVVLLNHAGTAPELTNKNCSFWHFRVAIPVPEKLDALTTFMVDRKEIRKVYLINQNYATGQGASQLLKEHLKKKRPDVEIVGDDLHPFGQVKDFAPYVAKMKAAGADTVITTSWGVDFALLAKAMKDADLQVSFYPLFGGATGGPTAMKGSWDGQVRTVSTWQPNDSSFTGTEYLNAVEQKYKGYDYYYYFNDSYNVIRMLAAGIKAANSVAPLQVARAMEGLKFTSLNGEELEMRASDHQLQVPLWTVEWQKKNGTDVLIDQENTGYGWKALQKLEIAQTTQPTTCEMKRP